MKDLKGRVAVVTGAGTGMGRSIALSLAAEGVNVVVSDIEAAVADAVRDEVQALNVRSMAVAADVSKLDQVQALADAAYAEFGKVDILVNNAGVTLRPFRAVWDTSPEDFRWVTEINLFGVFNGLHAFVPRMRQQPGEKHIVNTSSMGTLVKVPGHSTYVASKAAVNGLSDTIREELADDGFGVTILFPGHVKTRIATSERLRPAEERSEARKVIPYDTYSKHKSDSEQGANPNVAGGTVRIRDADDMIVGKDPDEIGPMVVKAIRENEPYCTTHAVPSTAIRNQADALLRAYIWGGTKVS